jgi:hypothetical protein
MRIQLSITLIVVLAVAATPVAAQQQEVEQQGTKQAAAAKAQPAGEWTVLFDGKSMKGWSKPKGFDYDDAGEVELKDGSMILNGGLYATGIRWPGKFPKTNYEIQLEAQRVRGYDFFCGMSFPVGEGALTLILGGWGGYLTGLSCVDGYRADENETCGSIDFKNKKWYRVRVRVTDQRVTAQVDDDEVCSLRTKDRKLTVTSEMEPCLPFGIATWGDTTGALRNIRYRMLTKEEISSEDQ